LLLFTHSYAYRFNLFPFLYHRNRVFCPSQVNQSIHPEKKCESRDRGEMRSNDTQRHVHLKVDYRLVDIFYCHMVFFGVFQIFRTFFFAASDSDSHSHHKQPRGILNHLSFCEEICFATWVCFASLRKWRREKERKKRDICLVFECNPENWTAFEVSKLCLSKYGKLYILSNCCSCVFVADNQTLFFEVTDCYPRAKTSERSAQREILFISIRRGILVLEIPEAPNQ
jgi:hypothetical protein